MMIIKLSLYIQRTIEAKFVSECLKFWLEGRGFHEY